MKERLPHLAATTLATTLAPLHLHPEAPMRSTESSLHVANVMGALERGAQSGQGLDDWLRQSWHRSVERHRLDPGRSYSRRVLTAPELREASDRMGLFLDAARPHIDDLDRHVSVANYCILLTDASGLTLDYRNRSDPDGQFKKAGVRVGICWSEQEEGTCGIGTAIIDRRPVLVHKGEHFRADNIPLSCSAAPLFGLDDELIGVLDASTLYSPYKRDSQALVFHLVNEKARLIENAYAERTLQSHWRLFIGTRREHRTPEAELMIAFGDDGRVVGANRAARQHLLGAAGKLGVACLEDLFGCTLDELLALTHRAPGVPLPLRLSATGALLYGLLRAPAGSLPAARQAAPPLPATRAEALPGAGAFAHLATGDRRLRDTVAKACKVADRNVPVMLLGETGTGKEAFAKALHQASQRRAKPFVALNCAAIPETLIESELFGYRDGAFTGARARGAKGKIAQADGGTLFLDEIGDMPLLLQSRLLRVLAEGEVLPLGADEPLAVAVNVVCATHQSLPALIRAGRFREDLYYRLSGAVFSLPPLRERDDIGDIIRRVLQEECVAMGRPVAEIERAAMDLLKRHPWPGNIRQLRHALRYACAIGDAPRLGLADLPAELLADTAAPHPAEAGDAARVVAEVAEVAPPSTATAPPADGPASEQREAMLAALRRHRWHVALAARELGVPRSTFYRRMAALKIVPPNLA